MDDQPGEQEGQPTPPGGVLTRVCVTCGKENYLTATDTQVQTTCEKCGSTVFREFFTHTDEDEAATDFEDSTGRDLDADDAEGDAMPGDVIDLNPR